MSSKIRKQIYLEQRQEHLLKAMSTTGYAYAQQGGVSEAKIIRQSIDLTRKF
ncbi:hypothetical protein [Nostoc sp.]|uniref:hypothetical protein n=1 Tax=Nostoc sp. TaxID=1180 RepID=UPI002FF8C57D